MYKAWWKILAALLLIYTIVGGFLMKVPRLPILNETVRNMYFHVTMWFGMMVLFGISLFHSIKYLRTLQYKYDINANAYAQLGILYGLIGYATGTLWVKYTWITSQNQSLANVLKEPKLVGAAIAILIYCAYSVLRSSLTDMDKRARIAAVYNIFAFAMLFPTIWIIPRLVGSLHPGAPGSDSGNPALGFKDVDTSIRIVFWPAVIGWTLLGVWMATLKIRMQMIKDKSLIHA